MVFFLGGKMKLERQVMVCSLCMLEVELWYKVRRVVHSMDDKTSDRFIYLNF